MKKKLYIVDNKCTNKLKILFIITCWPSLAKSRASIIHENEM